MKTLAPEVYSFRSSGWAAHCFVFGITARIGSPMLILTGIRGEPTKRTLGNESKRQMMEAAGTAQARVRRRANQASRVEELARFFPEASPVRIPVELSSESCAPGDEGKPLRAPENTVIEFGTAREVLFACSTAVEFADVLRLRNSDGSLDTEASVVAVQYHPGTTVVAARFLKDVPNWIVKP